MEKKKKKHNEKQSEYKKVKMAGNFKSILMDGTGRVAFTWQGKERKEVYLGQNKSSF